MWVLKSLSEGFHLLGVRYITSLKANLCISNKIEHNKK
jgi:hypothetical protein